MQCAITISRLISVRVAVDSITPPPRPPPLLEAQNELSDREIDYEEGVRYVGEDHGSNASCTMLSECASDKEARVVVTQGLRTHTQVVTPHGQRGVCVKRGGGVLSMTGTMRCFT